NRTTYAQACTHTLGSVSPPVRARKAGVARLVQTAWRQSRSCRAGFDARCTGRISDVVDVESPRSPTGKPMHERAARWTVIGGPIRVSEVDLDHGDVAARNETHDLCPNAQHDRRPIVVRPFSYPLPVSVA